MTSLEKGKNLKHNQHQRGQKNYGNHYYDDDDDDNGNDNIDNNDDDVDDDDSYVVMICCNIVCRIIAFEAVHIYHWLKKQIDNIAQPKII